MKHSGHNCRRLSTGQPKYEAGVPTNGDVGGTVLGLLRTAGRPMSRCSYRVDGRMDKRTEVASYVAKIISLEGN